MKKYEDITLKDDKGAPLHVRRYKDKPDPLHPGFEITGWKWKWLSARKSEDGGNFDVETLLAENLPKSLLEWLKRHGVFAKGNTIRNGDLVLGYTTNERSKQRRIEKDELAVEQMKRIARNPANSKAFKVESEVTQHVGADFFKDDRD